VRRRIITLVLWSTTVEGQVEREHVHPRLAEKAELTTFGVAIDQGTHGLRL